jgi:hypothetical protein
VSAYGCVRADTVDPDWQPTYTSIEMMLQRNERKSLRLNQFLLTAALVTPLAFAIATAPPFAVDTQAQAGAGMLGPRAPALVGSERVAPARSGDTVAVPSSWACGSTTNYNFTLSDPEGGRFRTAGRTMGPKTQTLTVASVVDGFPRTLLIRDTGLDGHVRAATELTLQDQNRDGVIDGVLLSGAVSGATSFVFSPDGNYISIPWSQASALGIPTSGTCAGSVPQVWIPLADTNGDGRGDSVILDLDGNGQADLDLFSTGPPVFAIGVPALGAVGRFVLVMVLGLIGTWFLSKRSAGHPGTPTAT